MSIIQPICQPICQPIVAKLTDYVGGGLGYAAIINDAGQLAPYVTFTRSSTATRYNSAGLLETVAANAPRYDYDPVTKVLRGLLIEEQRTNLLLDSAVLSTQSRTVTAVAHTLSFYGTGTVTLSGASTAGPLVGTGANNRVTLTFTPTAGTLTLTVSGTVTNAQLEAGAFATSYIPTTTAAVTRAADVARVTSLSLIGFNAHEGSVFSEFSYLGGSAAQLSSRAIWSFSDGTTSNRFFLYNGSEAARFYGATAGVNDMVLVSGVGNISEGVVVKSANAYKLNNYASCVNSLALVEDTNAAVPTVTEFWVGCGNFAGVSNFTSGHIRRLRYYPKRLTNAELQALTT